MELRVVDDPDQAQFEIWADDELAGILQYHLRNGVISLLHTQTDDRFRGQGLAGRLVQDTLDAVQERHLQVLPYCPYVRRWIGDHPAYADLVPEGRRSEFGL